jgi:hypothetical protein
MAHKKGVGSSRNGRDSQAQRLGLKKFGGEKVLGGNIIGVVPASSSAFIPRSKLLLRNESLQVRDA